MTRSQSYLRDWEKDLPRAKELLAQGYTESEVRHEIARELNCLEASVQEAYAVAGEAGVASVFSASTLFDSVTLHGTYASYWIRGAGEPRAHRAHYHESPCAIKPYVYEKVVEQLRTVLQNLSAAEPSLVLVTIENVWSITGAENVAAARAQIVHAARYQSVNALPKGPFKIGALELYAVIKAARVGAGARPNTALQPSAPHEGNR